MTDTDKMDDLMEKHAAKSGKPREQPLKALVDAWELEDDREAKLVCPQCGKARTAKVPKAWWAIAEKRGDTKPWWKRICTPCAEGLDAAKEFAKPKPPAVSEELELELPEEEE